MVMSLKNIVRWMAVVVLVLSAQPLWAATITVQSDRNPVAMNESFRLVFEADGSVDDKPDFKPLEQDFEILRQSQGTSMQLINGQVSQKRQWTVIVMPKRSGRLTVPSIAFGADRSRPLVIGVTEAAVTASDAEKSALFIEVTTEPKAPYVQSQLIYTVRLYRAINIANASLSEPQISDADVVVEKLGDDREFETTRNGRRYVVLERSYAVFPQQSGKLTISPVTFEGQLVNRSRGMFDVFEQGGPIRRVRSEAVTLNVQPKPASVDKQTWLPAREVRLVEEWPEGFDITQAVKAGEPLTWTLTLIADGLTAAQLPTITPEMPQGVKAYPDQARQHNERKPNTLIGVRQEKVALIPTHAGEYRLPAIEIPWWNAVSNKREIVRLPARSLHVMGVSPIVTDGVSDLLSVDHAAGVAVQPTSSAVPPVEDNRWQMVSLLMACGWALTIIAWLFSRRPVQRGSKIQVGAKIAPDLSEIKSAMRDACHSNNPVAVKEALLAWARIRWQAHPPGSLGELAGRVDAPLSDDIRLLNCLLYRASNREAVDRWGGARMWDHFSAEISRSKVTASRDVNGAVLTPMYP